jgi:hypothetical protein
MAEIHPNLQDAAGHSMLLSAARGLEQSYRQLAAAARGKSFARFNRTRLQIARLTRRFSDGMDLLADNDYRFTHD